MLSLLTKLENLTMNTDQLMYDRGDTNRIEFLQSRDTAEEVIAFAEQCIRVYRGASLASKRKHKRQGRYRKEYAYSYLFHKRYVKENKL